MQVLNDVCDFACIYCMRADTSRKRKFNTVLCCMNNYELHLNLLGAGLAWASRFSLVTVIHTC